MWPPLLPSPPSPPSSFLPLPRLPASDCKRRCLETYIFPHTSVHCRFIAGCFDGFQQMLAIPNDNLFPQRFRSGPSSFLGQLYYGLVAPRKCLSHRRMETSFLPKAEILNRDLFSVRVCHKKILLTVVRRFQAHALIFLRTIFMFVLRMESRTRGG